MSRFEQIEKLLVEREQNFMDRRTFEIEKARLDYEQNNLVDKIKYKVENTLIDFLDYKTRDCVTCNERIHSCDIHHTSNRDEILELGKKLALKVGRYCFIQTFHKNNIPIVEPIIVKKRDYDMYVVENGAIIDHNFHIYMRNTPYSSSIFELDNDVIREFHERANNAANDSVKGLSKGTTWINGQYEDMQENIKKNTYRERFELYFNQYREYQKQKAEQLRREQPEKCYRCSKVTCSGYESGCDGDPDSDSDSDLECDSDTYQ